MLKLIVYTCVTDGYDWILPPVWTSSEVRHICFTDTPELKVKGWELRPLPSLSPRGAGPLSNRYCKFFPWSILPEHDWSLYIDASVRILKDPRPIIYDAKRARAEIAITEHPYRSTIWQEVEACERSHKFTDDDRDLLDLQLQRYRNAGLPEEHGLTQNSVVFRSGDSKNLPKVMEIWWQELVSGVKRDQISLPYVLWSTGTSVYRIPDHARKEDEVFGGVPHRKEGNVYRYLQARRHHGAIWESAFQCLQILLRAKSRILRKT